ncbi:MAG: diguanylate cyclase (GGDEF)-like protein, partial [Paraglaciecola sp.]
KAKAREKLLIVDDEEINLEILDAGLCEKYQIIRCTSALKVLKVAVEEQPDTILLDISMPEMNGYQVCDALKKNNKTRHIPVIFSTALDSEEDEIMGFEFGASDYITKPFSMQLVQHRVSNLVALKRKTDLLEELASLDALTDIPNRRYFDLTFDTEWRRAVRRCSVISICMLDVDCFKQFNDHYGHGAGDKCLIDIANELNVRSKRAGDVVARYGGEEFVILLPENSSIDATIFAEFLRKNIAALGIMHEYSNCADRVTVSIGVATVVAHNNMKKESLLKQADKQLYIAKKKGRNQVASIDL